MELDIYALSYAEYNRVGYTNIYGKAKPFLAFETVVILFVCCYGMFDTPCVFEFSTVIK